MKRVHLKLPINNLSIGDFAMKKNIAILFGGVSSEHEVSRVSAAAVLTNINQEKYNIYKVGITKDGKWMLYTGPESKMENGEWEFDSSNKQAVLSPDRNDHGLIVIGDTSFEKIHIDAIFPVLHGKNGEDGTVQGLCELAGIPFVGCDMVSSATCMDKVITNILLTNDGVEKAKFVHMWASEYRKEAENVIRKVEASLEYPIFVKPSKAGSSVGINKAHDQDELRKAIDVALKEDNRVLFEETIVGREIECAVLGNDELFVSVVGEVAPTHEFYDYEAKYISGDSKLFIPAQVSDEISDKIRKIACEAYKIMGCSGLARVDFLLEDGTDRIFINELNTLPGFTSISMYSKLMNESGISYSELIDKLIDLAIERKR